MMNESLSLLISSSKEMVGEMVVEVEVEVCEREGDAARVAAAAAVVAEEMRMD